MVGEPDANGRAHPRLPRATPARPPVPLPSPPATPATPGLRAPSAATRSPGFLACALAIARKDLQIELRTREIVTTGGFFAVLVTVMASIAFSAGPKTQVRIAPGAIWLPIAFASVLALGRTWQREREESALTGLLVAPVPRASIFAGKALGVLALMLAVEALVVPTVALLFHIDVVPYLPKLLPLLLLGTLGIAATGTLFGAMTVRTSARISCSRPCCSRCCRRSSSRPSRAPRSSSAAARSTSSGTISCCSRSSTPSRSPAASRSSDRWSTTEPCATIRNKFKTLSHG